MKRILRWFAYGLTVFAGLIVLAVLALYVVTERRLGRTYAAPLPVVAVRADSAALARGEHLTRISGCAGCHGADLGGRPMFDFRVPIGGRVTAPNLTRVRSLYSDAELARIVRDGIRPDGSGTLAMPTEMYHHLSDADLAAIIAYVRTRPEVENDPPRTFKGPLLRAMILHHIGARPGPERVRRDTPRAGDRLDGSAERLGEYLAFISCAECHGADLRGGKDGQPPDLRIVAAYSPEQFTRLMREGIGLGDRELGLMTAVARDRFLHFTDEEIAALHAFARASVTQPDDATALHGSPVQSECRTMTAARALDVVRQEYVDAFNRGDAEAVAALHTHASVSMPAGLPTVTGRESIRELMQASRQLCPRI